MLQDPTLGTVVLTMDQFNQFYTGYALTLNGVGTPLGLNELQSLFGGNLDSLNNLQGSYLSNLNTSNPNYQKLKAKWDSLTPAQKEEIRNAAHPLRIPEGKLDPLTVLVLSALAIGGFIILTGGTGAAILVPLIPFAGESGAVAAEATAATGAAEAAAGTAASAAAAAETAAGAGITATLMELLPPALRPGAKYILTQGPRIVYTAQEWFFRGFSACTGDVVGMGQAAFEILGTRLPWPLGPGISSLISNPLYQQTSLQLNVGQLADYLNKPNNNIMNSINGFATSINESVIKPITDGFKRFYDDNIGSTVEKFNEKVQTYTNTISEIANREYKEYKQKGLIKYCTDKYYQVKSYYDTNFKPAVETYVKPVVHFFLDPIVGPMYEAAKSVPVVKQGMDFIGGIGKDWGLW